jgi:hypothetical protein
MRKLFFFLLLICLAGCNLPRRAITILPTATSTATPTPTSTPTSEPPSSQDCYFNWATQSLPELSAEVQAAMEKAGLKGVTAVAEAYGENCYDSQTNKVVYFATLETDFLIDMDVPSLRDAEALGQSLDEILIVLDQFPADSTPGPQSGYVGVVFKAGTEAMRLWFLQEKGIAAREQGLHGAALLEEVQKK